MNFDIEQQKLTIDPDFNDCHATDRDKADGQAVYFNVIGVNQIFCLSYKYTFKVLFVPRQSHRFFYGTTILHCSHFPNLHFGARTG